MELHVLRSISLLPPSQCVALDSASHLPCFIQDGTRPDLLATTVPHSPACCGPLRFNESAKPQPQDGTRPDLLATTGDFLRLWRVSDEPGSAQQGVRLEKLLNNVGWHVALGWLRCARCRACGWKAAVSCCAV